jgi:hypothetical protein
MANAVNVPFTATDDGVEAARSGVSWAAVLAGAFVTAALSFILMAFGAGMGLSSLSPWPSPALHAPRAAPLALIWVALVQALACAMGGYLAGRLRTKWVAVHTHEVFFRDTAHGFLVWAVGLVISAFFLSSVVLAVTKDILVSHPEGRHDYFVDSLLRSEPPTVDRNDGEFRAEAREILATAVRQTDTPPQDRSYLAGMVSARTGLNRQQAEARVDQTLALYREALDKARKAVAHSLYWLFAAYLIGAFCASFAATFGGRQRDAVVSVSATSARRT